MISQCSWNYISKMQFSVTTITKNIFALSFQEHRYIKKLKQNSAKKFVPKITRNVPLYTNIFKINLLEFGQMFRNCFGAAPFSNPIILWTWLFLIIHSLGFFCSFFLYSYLRFVELLLQILDSAWYCKNVILFLNLFFLF